MARGIHARVSKVDRCQHTQLKSKRDANSLRMRRMTKSTNQVLCCPNNHPQPNECKYVLDHGTSLT